MQNLKTLRAKGQESFSNLIERGKQQPEEVKTWGITAAAGVGGALAVAAVAKGVLAIVATLANPPIALTVGAIGGGALGWSLMQKQGGEGDATGASTVDTGIAETAATEASTEATATTAAVPEAPAAT